jgi:hypothetical protein
MEFHRFVMVGAAVLAAGLTVAGCGGQRTGGTPSIRSSASPSVPPPKEAVLASVGTLTLTSYEVTAKVGDSTYSGVVDPATKSASMSVAGTVEGDQVKMDLVATAAGVWLKIDLGASANQEFGVKPSKWMSVDVAKVHGGIGLPFDVASKTDVLDMPDLLAGVVDARRVDATHYTGTMDLAKTGGVVAPSTDDLEKLGDKASSIPFTAILDSQYRLTKLTVDTTAADPLLATDLTFSNFGAAQRITKPIAAETIAMPAKVYTLFNS